MKKKILILVESLKIGGGSERVAALLGSKLVDRGYEVSYLTLMDKKPKYKFEGNYFTLNQNDYEANNFKLLSNLLKDSPKIKRICNDLEVDVVISLAEEANFHAVLSRWLYGNKSRIIISQHMNPEIHLYSRLKSFALKFFYSRADVTVCVSKTIEKILNQSFNVKNTQTIYNMMDIDNNLKLSKEKLPSEYKQLMEGEGFKFINMGRLTRQKGQWFLIRSFKRVLDKYPGTKLIILGEGDLKENLRDLIKILGLNKNVFLIGDQENVFPFLKNGDCFVSTSLWEGLPMVLIEALSVNLPIVSADCKTGPREILCPELDLMKELEYPCMCEYGILTPPFADEQIFSDLTDEPLNDLEKTFSDVLIKTIKDTDQLEKYRNGEKITGRFDIKHIMDEWEKLLN